jgi:hypothetical protein
VSPSLWPIAVSWLGRALTGRGDVMDDRTLNTAARSVRVRTLAVATMLTLLAACASAAGAERGERTDSRHQTTSHDHQGHHGDLGQPPGATQRDLAKVRSAVARYHTPERAEAAGWVPLEGLDHCFEHPELGGMGVHYIDPDQLGTGTLDPLRPEALVFVPGPHGQLRLGAVEYIVPIGEFPDGAPDLDDLGDAPSVLDRDLHVLNPVGDLYVWGLHVWLFQRNPAGMFADWNPRVSCDGFVEPGGDG